MSKRISICFLLFSSFALFSLAFCNCAAAQGYWELVDVKSGQGKNFKDRCGEQRVTISEGIFSLRTVYFAGVCNHRKEEIFSASASWTPPPKRLNPGEIQPFTISAKRGSNIPGLFLSLGLSISIDLPRCPCGSVCGGGDDLGRVKANSRAKSDTATKTVKFKVPAGSKDASLAIRFCPSGSFHHGQPGFRYIYQWVQAEENNDGSASHKSNGKVEPEDFKGKEQDSADAKAWAKKAAIDKANKASIEEAKKAGRKDSGAGFSDINGQVLICPHSENPEDEDNWEEAKLTSVIFVYDHIKTGDGSSAIIGFADMSTFIMRPNTEIMISSPPKPKSKLALVWGNIVINFKKMLKDGSMDIEMNQCSGGIKGTKLECWDTGDTSRIAVYEGIVEVVSKSTGQTVVLHPGQEVTATTNGFDLPIGQDTRSKLPEQNSAEPKKTNIPVDRSDEREWQSLGQKSNGAKESQTLPSVRDKGVPKGHTTKYGF